MYQNFELKNGFPVILVPKVDSKSLTLLVLYGVGSRYEDPEVNQGVSHFIEHLMFKGTKKRPSSLDITKELDGIGAEFNAYTAKDHTGYYIKANAEKLDLAANILSDMLNNSLFAANEIKREKGVIVEEIRMYEDQPMFFSEILFERLVFKNSGLEHDVAGTEKIVKQMQREDVVDYFNSFYRPDNGAIVIAGKIDEKVKNVLNKYFAQHKKDQPEKKNGFKKFIDEQKEPRLNFNYRETKQVHLAMGFPAYSYFHPDLYALHLLSVILGGSMSSRLFVNIREKKGLCYYIKSQADIYQDTGNLMIRSGLDKNKIKEAIKIIIGELRKIKNKGISEKELKMAKEFLKGRLTLQLEESNHLAEFYGKQFILTNKILTAEQKIEKIFAVTKKQVEKVAKDIIKIEKFNLAMIGPFKDKKEFLKLIKF